MRFWRDPAAPLVTVRWYFVPESRPALPFDSVFTSRIWEPYPVGWYELGEVEGDPRPWRDGSTVGDAPGVRACGTAEQWVAGDQAPTYPMLVDDLNTPLCCFAAPPAAFNVITTCCPDLLLPNVLNTADVFGAGRNGIAVYDPISDHWYCTFPAGPGYSALPIEIRLACKPGPFGPNQFMFSARFTGEQWPVDGSVFINCTAWVVNTAWLMSDGTTHDFSMHIPP